MRPFILYMSLFIVFFVDVYAVMSIIIMFLCGRFHRIVGSCPRPPGLGAAPMSAPLTSGLDPDRPSEAYAL